MVLLTLPGLTALLHELKNDSMYRNQKISILHKKCTTCMNKRNVYDI